MIAIWNRHQCSGADRQARLALWHAPALTRFGPIAALTASGSNFWTEILA